MSRARPPLNVPRKAVIPAAGLGTRLRPATDAVPKELFPIGRFPAIEWVIAEAIAAGCSDIAVVISPTKSIIRRYLQARREITDRCALTFLVQRRPLGFGQALLLARRFCAGEPFAVLLPDNLHAGPPAPLVQMLPAFARVGGAVFSLIRRRPGDCGPSPGIRLARRGGGLYRVTGIARGPRSGRSRTRLTGFGRYLLAPECLDHAERAFRGLTGGMDDGAILGHMLSVGAPVHTVVLAGRGFDIVDRAGYQAGLRELGEDDPLRIWRL